MGRCKAIAAAKTGVVALLLSWALFSLSLILPTADPATASPSPPPGTESYRIGSVTVHHAPSDEALARRVAGRAVDLQSLIMDDLGLEREVGADILLLTPKTPEAVSRAFEESLEPWLAGAAYPRRRFIVLRLPPGRTLSGLDGLLAHELTHVILQEDYPLSGSWPRWFEEGLAMRESGEGGFRRGATLSLAALRRRLIPLDELWSSFPGNEAGSRLAYAQSFSVIAYLHTRFGRDRFHAFMGNLRDRDFEKAFRLSYGFSLGVMEREWRRYVHRRYSWVPLATGGTAFWMLIVGVFFLALFFRRRKDRLLHLQWEEEERPPRPSAEELLRKEFPEL
jgi:hypothetical protein